jgi:hypothetical protein
MALWLPPQSDLAPQGARVSTKLRAGRNPRINWAHPLLRAAQYVVCRRGMELYVYFQSGTQHPATFTGGALIEVNGYLAPDTTSRLSFPKLTDAWRTAGTLAFAGYWSGRWYGAGFARLLLVSGRTIRSSSGSWLSDLNGSVTFPAPTGYDRWVFKQSGGDGGPSQLWKRGSLIRSADSALTFTDVNSDFNFGTNPTIDRYVEFGLGVLAVVMREWSDDEIRSFCTDPYQVFFDDSDDPYLISTGATAPGVPTSLLNQNLAATSFRSAWTAPA